jgi:hypothetical protein
MEAADSSQEIYEVYTYTYLFTAIGLTLGGSSTLHKQTHTHAYIYKQTPWTESSVRSSAGPQLVKKFTAFYGTRKFIIAFKVSSTFPIPSKTNPIHAHI